jgi:hypothetical protein
MRYSCPLSSHNESDKEASGADNHRWHGSPITVASVMYAAPASQRPKFEPSPSPNLGIFDVITTSRLYDDLLRVSIAMAPLFSSIVRKNFLLA